MNFVLESSSLSTPTLFENCRISISVDGRFPAFFFFFSRFFARFFWRISYLHVLFLIFFRLFLCQTHLLFSRRFPVRKRPAQLRRSDRIASRGEGDHLGTNPANPANPIGSIGPTDPISRRFVRCRAERQLHIRVEGDHLYRLARICRSARLSRVESRFVWVPFPRFSRSRFGRSRLNAIGNLLLRTTPLPEPYRSRFNPTGSEEGYLRREKKIVGPIIPCVSANPKGQGNRGFRIA